MKALYIFPHPDDESFGVGHAMSKQGRDGHEIHLLTLTRGGATRQRHKFGYSVEEMGAVRYQEMQEVKKVLGLKGLTVLDFPDSGLKEVDPRELERAIREEIDRVRPQVIVTYPVHGVSGFHDHLVAHAVVKRVFVEFRGVIAGLERLAFATIVEDQARESDIFPLSFSKPEEIDCVISVEPRDIAACRKALDCYVTFKETIERTGIKDKLRKEVPFELFDEEFDPPLDDYFQGC